VLGEAVGLVLGEAVGLVLGELDGVTDGDRVGMMIGAAHSRHSIPIEESRNSVGFMNV